MLQALVPVQDSPAGWRARASPGLEQTDRPKEQGSPGGPEPVQRVRLVQQAVPDVAARALQEPVPLARVPPEQVLRAEPARDGEPDAACPDPTAEEVLQSLPQHEKGGYPQAAEDRRRNRPSAEEVLDQ